MLVAKLTEQMIQKSCMDYLRLKGYFCYKINNVGIKKSNGSYIPSQTKGLPDCVFHTDEVVSYIEFKTPIGKLSEHQMAFQKNCYDNNIPYFVIRSLDDLMKVI